MARLLSIVTLLVNALASVAAAAKKEPEPAPNPVVDYIQGIVSPVGNSVLGLATDAYGLVLAAPTFGVDVFVWAVNHVRSLPDLVKNVYNGDAATLDNMTSFCTYASSVIFCLFVSLTALNLTLATFARVKDHFSGYMVIPTVVLGQKLPEPVLMVRNVIQKEILDRVRSFRVGSWIVPLEGQSGSPSLAGALPVLASTVSTCMILSCAPAIHSLIKSGADKGAAEAIAYTMGTALGIQYLVKKVA